jgi:hypothetical protein
LKQDLPDMLISKGKCFYFSHKETSGYHPVADFGSFEPNEYVCSHPEGVPLCELDLDDKSNVEVMTREIVHFYNCTTQEKDLQSDSVIGLGGTNLAPAGRKKSKGYFEGITSLGDIILAQCDQTRGCMLFRIIPPTRELVLQNITQLPLENMQLTRERGFFAAGAKLRVAAGYTVPLWFLRVPFIMRKNETNVPYQFLRKALSQRTRI